MGLLVFYNIATKQEEDSFKSQFVAIFYSIESSSPSMLL